MPMYHGLGDGGGSRFKNNITHISPNYKILFFLKRGNRTQPYMFEAIPLYAIRIIASIRLSSHHLRCETGRWGTREEALRLCTLCALQVRESKHHTLLECSAFGHIRIHFPQLFSENHLLYSFLSQPNRGLSISAFITKILEHRELLMSLTPIM